MKIISATFLFLNIIITLGVSQNLASYVNDSARNDISDNSLYIGFSKSSSQDERLSILNSTPGSVVEQLTLMDYPIYRIEFDQGADNSTVANIRSELEKKPAVIFVSNEKNLDEKQISSLAIKRQGDMSISKSRTKLDKNSSAEYRTIILNHMPGLNICVEKYSPGQKRNRIKALYEIDIDNRGAVKNVRLLDSNIKSPKLRSCLKKKIASWRDFPRRRGNEDLNLKFKFNY